MIFGHTIVYVFNDEPRVARIPDMALLPVFLVTIGFNAGYKTSWSLWLGAIATTICSFFYFGVIRAYVLGTIIAIRYILEPMMEILIRNKYLFWAANVVFIILAIPSDIFFQFGTMALILAMAGWINVNKSIVPKEIVNPRDYFVFASCVYLVFMSYKEDLSWVLVLMLIPCLAVIMWLLFNFKALLLNSIKKKPKNHQGKLWRYIGHKSLEIYVIQHIAFFTYVYFYLL